MKIRKKPGIAIVEVVLAIALFLVFLSAVGQLLSIGIVGANLAKIRLQAAYLATEGMEAITLIRRNDEINFDPAPGSDVFVTASNEYYQPALSGSNWSMGSKLTTQPPAPMTGNLSRFTRIVKIEKVNRVPLGLSCSGEISYTGSTCDDFNTRKVTVTVSWSEQGNSNQYQIIGLISNI